MTFSYELMSNLPSVTLPVWQTKHLFLKIGSISAPYSTGDERYNYELSQRRALAVANYLAGQGVDSRRFAVTGFGETRPIADNNSPAGRALNRRVEIQLSPLT